MFITKRKKQVVLPPNCDNKTYFVDIHVCTPDNLCSRIKNPVSYAKKRLFSKAMSDKKKKSGKREKKTQPL